MRLAMYPRERYVWRRAVIRYPEGVTIEAVVVSRADAVSSFYEMRETRLVRIARRMATDAYASHHDWHTPVATVTKGECVQ